MIAPGLKGDLPFQVINGPLGGIAVEEMDRPFEQISGFGKILARPHVELGCIKAVKGIVRIIFQSF